MPQRRHPKHRMRWNPLGHSLKLQQRALCNFAKSVRWTYLKDKERIDRLVLAKPPQRGTGASSIPK